MKYDYFCTDDGDSITFEEYKGPILDHHVNSRDITVPRFNDNNSLYLPGLSGFVNLCISKLKDIDDSVLINVRLGTKYFDAELKEAEKKIREQRRSKKDWVKRRPRNLSSEAVAILKDSCKVPISDKRRRDFNSEAGARFEENIEWVEEYVSQKGFTSKHTNKKLKVNCNDGNLYTYEMENLNPVFDNICDRLGTFDIFHNRNEIYIEDVRVQISALRELNNSSSPSSPHVAKNENGNIILVNPEKVGYVRKQESSVYYLSEEKSQLDGISMHFRLDKKTQLDHKQETLDRCLTTFTGAQIIISGSKDTFTNGAEFEKKLSEILYDYSEWLSKMCAQLDVRTNNSVLYYKPGCEQGYTREQDLIIKEMANELRRKMDGFTEWRNDFQAKLHSVNNHPSYNELLQIFTNFCDSQFCTDFTIE